LLIIHENKKQPNQKQIFHHKPTSDKNLRQPRKVPSNPVLSANNFLVNTLITILDSVIDRIFIVNPAYLLTKLSESGLIKVTRNVCGYGRQPSEEL
jgi:hypothetical protein